MHHGDEIHIVHRKDEDNLNVAYIYQNLKQLEEAMQHNTEMQNGTHENSGEDSSEPKKKRFKLDEKDSGAMIASENTEADSKTEEDGGKCDANKNVSLENENNPCTPCTSDTEYITSTASGGTAGIDDFEENLQCTICQEILHDCISLQPCMHSFCSGCYSDWMKKSNICPSCRLKVERINKNHMVNNLVDAYLKQNPEKQRSEEELKQIDARNSITKDMLYPKKKHSVEIDSDDDDSLSDITSSLDTDDSHIEGAAPGMDIRFPQCRQCRGYEDTYDPNWNPDMPGTSASTSLFTNNMRSTATAPHYVCSPRQEHIMCHCCLSMMPDRRFEGATNIPASKCELCHKTFCHLYWGCTKSTCLGCLGLFEDMDFGEESLDKIILENSYESQILKDYLKSENLTYKDLFRNCCEAVAMGEFVLQDVPKLQNDQEPQLPTLKTRVCRDCGIHLFRQLAYQYCAQIPKKKLPKIVTSRPDCYWGYNCYTQKHKQQHAQNFNHICEQTRHAVT